MKTARAREFVAETSSNEPHSKRARLSSESAEQRLFRHSAAIKRPGRPEPISLANFRFEGKVSPPLRSDDKEGHYVYELGENISSRYKILSKFGEGTFGRVLECWDRLERDYVAVKVVRAVDKYRHAAMIELEVLATLEQNDPTARRHCVRLKEWFDYRGHVCMVFERLGPSLYDFLRRNDYAPFSLGAVQSVARQVLSAVAYMHELRLVHTDLKPENVLLVSGEYDKVPAPVAGPAAAAAPPAPAGAAAGGGGGGNASGGAAAGGSGTAAANANNSNNPTNNGAPPALRRHPRSTAVRVIDFGSATFEDGYHSSVVSTRHYRAPEVILGLGWSYPCDLWSVGCILVELATGDALFQTHENLEHLAMMERALGPCPPPMVARADRQAQKLFGAGGALAWPPAQQDTAAARKSLAAVEALRDLKGLLEERCDPPPPAQPAAALLAAMAPKEAELASASARREHDLHVRAVALLADLAASCLRYDPEARVTAAAALQHPFFKLPLPGGALAGGGGQQGGQQQQLGAAGAAAAAAASKPAAGAGAAAGGEAPAAPPAPPAPLLAKAAKAAPEQQQQQAAAGGAAAGAAPVAVAAADEGGVGSTGAAAAAAAAGGGGAEAAPAQPAQQQPATRGHARVPATQQLVTAGSGGGAG